MTMKQQNKSTNQDKLQKNFDTKESYIK